MRINPLRIVLGAISLVTGVTMLLWLTTRRQKSPQGEVIELLCSSESKTGCALADLSLRNGTRNILYQFGRHEEAFYVTYAPAENRIGVLGGDKDDPMVDFTIFDTNGKLLKKVFVGRDTDILTRPFYRNGKFVFATTNFINTISSDGAIKRIEIDLPQRKQRIDRLGSDSNFVTLPDETYLFANVPAIRTKRIGFRGRTSHHGTIGEAYKYSPVQHSISRTFLPSYNLLPDHHTRIGVYEWSAAHQGKMLFVDDALHTEGSIVINSNFENIRWSPDDSRLIAWNDGHIKVYDSKSGSLVMDYSSDEKPVDWDLLHNL